jgi:hypothetical protein
MELKAMPFQLRDFMVKCWKRHRDVPTKISQLVDRAVEDLQRRQQDLKWRMTRNTIKHEPLEKVEHLLDCCFEVAENIPDDWDVETQELKERLRSIKSQKEILDMKLSNTQARFRQLAKKGRLGQAGANNWQWATSEAHNLRAVQVVSGAFEEPSSNAISGTADLSPLTEGTNSSAEIQDVGHAPQSTDEWVECVECSQWRRLPHEIKANTLPDDWKCSDGAAWRTGLTCNEPPDLEEDVSY